ncbi:hypothetical protein [Streptomyces sp. NPDC057250]|uniref:hypothetical protein n=1 Tax=Streptomyces sp. NPDC057250 TaxID=3346068 RepID=UPI0036361741
MDAHVAAVLMAVAFHYRTVDPDYVLEDYSLPVCVSVESFVLAERGLVDDSLGLARAVMAVAPEPLEGITRGEYVLHIRKTVLDAGHAWSDDDNAPVIPSIPRPRTEPVPAPARVPVKAPRQPGPEHPRLMLVPTPATGVTV